MSNYDKILREKENSSTLNDSTMEKHWAAMETKLNGNIIAKPTLKKGKLRKLWKGLIGVAVIAIIGLFTYKKLQTNTHLYTKKNNSEKTSVIKPPKPSINVPYEIFTFDAAIGDTLFTKNGSILIFPKNAVLYKNGEIVTGKVEVQTREFNDPLEYYMAGIPMQYDSAGVQYTFVSSAMIDIKAYQNAELLYVNPNAKPQLNLVSTNKETKENLYKLDTLTGQWTNKGKEEVNEVGFDIVKTNDISVPKNKLQYSSPVLVKYFDKKDSANDEVTISKPVAPQKASGKNPVIQIEIDPASFKELMLYNNLKFEVIGGDKWNEADSKIEWQNVELERHLNDENYSVEFSTTQRKVTYEVKPVLENSDYKEAVKLYDEKIMAYNTQLNNRRKEEQSALSAEQEQLNKNKEIKKPAVKESENNAINQEKNNNIKNENSRIEALNILILERNKQIEKLNIETAAENKRILNEIEKQNKLQDSIKILWEKQDRANKLNQNLIRTFEIDGFGYWNCDQPIIQNAFYVKANFIDKENRSIDFLDVQAIVKNENKITNIDYEFPIVDKKSHCIFGFANDNFYYLTFNEFDELAITSKTKAFTFSLHKYEGRANTITDLKRVLYDKDYKILLP